MRAVGAFVGHHGVGRRLLCKLLLRLVVRLAGLGELPFEFEDRAVVGLSSFAFERLNQTGQGVEFVGELPRVLLGPCQLHAGLGQVVGGAISHRPHVVDPPAKLLAGELQLFPFVCCGRRSRRAGRVGRSNARQLCRTAEDHQHNEERPHRAQQHGKERKQRDSRARLGTGSAHAAFPVRRMA